MGEGPHGGSSGGDNGTLNYLVVARGYWLPTKDHLGEKNSPIQTTHRWWVTRPSSLFDDVFLVQRCIALSAIFFHMHSYYTNGNFCIFVYKWFGFIWMHMNIYVFL